MIQFVEPPYTDPRAPWNLWEEHPREIDCPYCQGKGYLFGAENIRTGRLINCTETTFNILPSTADTARRQGKHWIQWKDECQECCGTGTLQEDVLPDEYYMERKYGI